MAKTYAEIAAESRSKDYATKVKLLKEIRTFTGELHKTDYKAQSDQWRTKFTELNKNAREGSKGAVKAIAELMKDKTALSVADRRMLSAYARDLAARSNGHSFNGEAEFRKIITKSQPGADQTGDYGGRFESPAEVKGRFADDLGSLSAYPPDSEMRYYLMGRVLGNGLFTEDELHKVVGEDAWQSFLTHRNDEGMDGARLAGLGDRIVLGNITTPDLDALKDEAVRAAKVKDADVPAFVYAPSDAEMRAQGKVDALASELADADAAGVDGEDYEHPGPARWYGATDLEAAKFVSKPGVQRWAKSWGLTDIGHVENGAFVPGRDTKKAFRLAAHQSFNATKKQMGDFNATAMASAPAQKVVLTPDKDGVVGAVWMVNDDGSIDKMDLATGEATQAKNARGAWASDDLKGAYAADAKADPPHPYGFKGKSAWTREDWAGRGPIDLIAEEEITSDPKEMKGARVDRVTGVRRLPNWGEDPETSAIVEQGDGSIVTLHRDSPDSPWRVVAGEPLHKNVGLPDEPMVAEKSEAKKEPTQEVTPQPKKEQKSALSPEAVALGDELQKEGEKLRDEASRHQMRESAGLDALEASTKAEEEKAAKSFMSRPMPADEAPVVATQAPVTPGKAVVAPPYEEPVPVNSPALREAEADWEERHKPGAVNIPAIVGRREVKDLGAELEAGGKEMVAAAQAERAAKAAADAARAEAGKRDVERLGSDLERDAWGEYWKVAGPRVKAEERAEDSAKRQGVVDRMETRELGRELEAGGQAMVDAARSERADQPLFKGQGAVTLDRPEKPLPAFKGAGTVTIEPTPEEEKAADALTFKGKGAVTPEGTVSDGSVTKEAMRRLRQRSGG